MNKFFSILTIAIIGYTGCMLAYDATDKEIKERSGYCTLEKRFVEDDAFTIEKINDDNFSDKISEGIVIVDFYANWCGPCRRLSPVFEKIGSEMRSSVTFYEAQCEENFKMREKYGIAGIPALVLFKDGKEIARRLGCCDEYVLRDFITSAL